ncbi:hypothetical protein BY458DRAFT_499563 [Sporodiniella umbellata]|nr:hypothetical protein BY458DRAFT_499563 [Sporodiniella umbellata]
MIESSPSSTLRGPRPLQKNLIPSWLRQREEKTEAYVYPPPKKALERKPSKTEIEWDTVNSPRKSLDSEQSDWDLLLSEEEEGGQKQDHSEEEEEEWDLGLKEFSSAHREAELSKITLEQVTDSEDEQDTPLPETKPRLPPIPDSPKETTPSIPQLCFPGMSDEEEEEEEERVSVEPKREESVYDTLFFTVRCGGCHQPLSGQAITTSGNQWHTRCFKCQSCRQPLEHIAFYERDGLPYCALDFHEQFSPRCDYCKTPIEEHSISALGKTYHPGHFFCRECGKPFDEHAHFLEHEGHAYCEKDYQYRFGKRCMGCEETITGEFLLALGGEWHKACFVCADCGKAFRSTFLTFEGKPYCDQHYPSLPVKKKYVPSLPSPPQDTSHCHRCQEPILGRSSSAFGKNYHPLHFQCSQCLKIMSPRITGLFQETDLGEIICKGCVRQKINQ